jgi:hypothetical protein
MNDAVIGQVTDHTALRMELLEKMRSLIQGTQHLSKVFDQRWFDEVKEIIHDARGKPGLVMPTHTAFIGFFHDAFWDNGGKNLLAELEQALHTISTTAKKTLREKLGRVSRGADDYIHFPQLNCAASVLATSGSRGSSKQSGRLITA